MMVCDDHRRLFPGAVAFGCLLLMACAGQTTEVRWTKAGADDQTVARELADCNAQAGAALANERGINEDIGATLGRNWALSSTQGVQRQTMSEQAAGFADQVFNNCMRAKGFTKES
jgi:hypothetical protein